MSEWLPADELDDAEEFRRHRSADEIRRVLEMADTEAPAGGWRARRLRAAVYLWAFTGAGKAEVLGLRTADVDLPDRVVSIRSHSARRLKTRSRAARMPLVPPVVERLAGWIPETGCEWLFPHSYRTGPWFHGRPGHRPLDEVKALGARAGVPGLTILSFRHTVGTLAEGWGIGELMLQRLLRHAAARPSSITATPTWIRCARRPRRSGSDDRTTPRSHAMDSPRKPQSIPLLGAVHPPLVDPAAGEPLDLAWGWFAVHDGVTGRHLGILEYERELAAWLWRQAPGRRYRIVRYTIDLDSREILPYHEYTVYLRRGVRRGPDAGRQVQAMEGHAMSHDDDLMSELREARLKKRKAFEAMSNAKSHYLDRKQEHRDAADLVEEILQEVETGKSGRPMLDAINGNGNGAAKIVTLDELLEAEAAADRLPAQDEIRNRLYDALSRTDIASKEWAILVRQGATDDDIATALIHCWGSGQLDDRKAYVTRGGTSPALWIGGGPVQRRSSGSRREEIDRRHPRDL